MKCFWAFSTFAVGGPQHRFATLAEALGPDHSHTVMAMDGCYDAERLLGKSVSYARREEPVRKTGFISQKNVDAFSRALRDARPDILLTSNWGTVEWRLANRSTKVPHIHFEDGFLPDEAGGRRSWKRDVARRILFSSFVTGHTACAFVAPSSQIDNLFKHVWRAPVDAIHLIPNGVDADRFSVARSDSTANTPLVIGSVGALRPEKRFDRLIDIFDRVRADGDIRLLIVGDGPERERLEELAAARGLQSFVEFAGAQENVVPFLKRMDVYAVTSDTEQMPISLVEAMAAGLPVVGSDVGDVKQMVAAENAPFVHDPADEASAANNIAAFLSNGELRRSVGEANARKAAAQYSLAQMVERYRALFAEISRKP
jgi:glycosyltransferase involved in cell wall biosynthesis